MGKPLSTLFSNKGKPRQLRRQRRLVLPQSSARRRHPGVRGGVVPSRRCSEQRAAAAPRLDEALISFFFFDFEQRFLLGARRKLRERELALEPPRGHQVPPPDRGLARDPGMPPPALRVDAGRGDVEDLERDERVAFASAALFAAVVIAAVAAAAAAASAGPSEVLRSEDELDRLFSCFLFGFLSSSEASVV